MWIIHHAKVFIVSRRIWFRLFNEIFETFLTILCSANDFALSPLILSVASPFCRLQIADDLLYLPLTNLTEFSKMSLLYERNSAHESFMKYSVMIMIGIVPKMAKLFVFVMSSFFFLLRTSLFFFVLLYFSARKRFRKWWKFLPIPCSFQLCFK